MATPLQVVHLDRVDSTQDEARKRFVAEPLLVTATGQDAGRGRNHAEWVDADRSLAASLAFRPGWPDEDLPRLTLVAGLAILDVLPDSYALKWPNDVVSGDDKAGGILTEAVEGLVVVGLGLNVYWAYPPAGVAGVHSSDPGPDHCHRVAAKWARHLLRRVDAGSDSWGRAEYLRRCSTIGRDVTWEPAGAGRAVGVSTAGALIVEKAGVTFELASGAVSEVRAG